MLPGTDPGFELNAKELNVRRIKYWISSGKLGGSLLSRTESLLWVGPSTTSSLLYDIFMGAARNNKNSALFIRSRMLGCITARKSIFCR